MITRFAPGITRIIALAGLLLAGCQPMELPQQSQVAPGGRNVDVERELPTDPPQPTATAVPPTSTPEPTYTPRPTATQTPDAAATQAAQATQTAAPMIAWIDEQLRKVGLSTEQGRFGGVAPLINLTVSSYLEALYDEPYPDLQVSDFVLHTQVSWHSTSGLAGCGVLFRADGLGGKRPNLYQLNLIRLQSAPSWWLNRSRKGQTDKQIVALKSSAAINDAQDSTNDLLLVVQGDKFVLYVNGERLGQGIDSALTDGALAFHALQESGKTTCTFSDTWLWILDTP